MSNFKNIQDLCRTEGGSLVIISELGEPQFVLLTFENYLKLKKTTVGLIVENEEKKVDPEIVNREIVHAQLTDTVDTPVNKKKHLVTDSLHIGNVLQEKIKNWPGKYAGPKINNSPDTDETIDPKFDFEGPKLSIEDINV